MRVTRSVLACMLGGLLGVGSSQDGLGGPSVIQPVLDEWGVRQIMTMFEQSRSSPSDSYPALVYVMMQNLEYLTEIDIDHEEAGLEQEPKPSACVYADGSGGVPQFGGGGGEDFDRPRGASQTYDPVTPAALSVPAGQGELVIVDDFDLASVADGTDLLAPTGADAPLLLDPDGSDNPLEAFHGDLVVFHVLRLLEATSAVLTRRPADEWVGERPTWLLSVKGHDSELTLVLVDVDYVDISTAIAALSGLTSNMTVNLSWNIFECDVIEGYRLVSDRLDAFPTIIDYVFGVLEAASARDAEAFLQTCAEILAGPHVTGAGLTLEDCLVVLTVMAAFDMERLAGLMYQDDLDSLEDILTGTDPARVYAASGNQGLSFALAPASWRGVNPVGACLQTTPPSKRAAFSNAALQLLGNHTSHEGYYAPGAWFGHGTFGKMKGYWGTSFSTPHVAVLDALGAPANRSPGCHSVN